MGIDAIIVSDTDEDSLPSTNPLKLQVDGRVAVIQAIQNFVHNQGHIVPPVEDNDTMNWSSAPKLNGIYLYNYLMKQGFHVGLINNYYGERDEFVDLLKESPRIVIISTTFITSKKELQKVVSDIRSLAPDVFVISGGTFVFLSYQMLQRLGSRHYEFATLKDDFIFIDRGEDPPVDLYIISLRGEEILKNAMERIKKNQPVDDLPNTAQYIGGRYFFGRRIDDISDASEISIDWRALPDTIFSSAVVPMEASSGCPYECAFCNFIKDRRLTFSKPIARLVDELRAVSDRGVRYVWFVDDNFRLGSGDLNAVCQRFIDEDINVEWMTFVRANALKKVDATLLRSSGCIEVQLGLESADPQILRNMNKRADPALYSEVIKKLLAAGINCSCYFIFGFPGETVESVRRTQEFIRSIEYPELDGVLSWSMFPFILSPLSPIYEQTMRGRYGLEGYMLNWRHNTMDSELARIQVLDTFLKLENSGAIYRGDNLRMLGSLNPRLRKQFISKRHKLSKVAVTSHLERADIIEEFNNFFSYEKAL